MARYKVINKVKTDTGYDTLNPMTPWQIQNCTVDETTSAANYVLTTDIPADNLDNVYVCMFYSTVENTAGATVTINGSSNPLPIRSDNEAVLAGQIKANDYTMMIIDQSNGIAHLISTGYASNAALSQNALKLGGQPIEYFARSNYGIVPDADILAWALNQTVSGTFTINNAITTVNLPESAWFTGFLDVSNGIRISITTLSSAATRRTYTNTYPGGAWQGWVNAADGGNAKAVNGYSPQTGGIRGIPVVGSDYGGTELGSYLDFHTAAGQDFAARLTANLNGFVIYNSAWQIGQLNANLTGSATKWDGYNIWRGSQAQYDAITSKSSTTVYFITG